MQIKSYKNMKKSIIITAAICVFAALPPPLTAAATDFENRERTYSNTINPDILTSEPASVFQTYGQYGNAVTAGTLSEVTAVTDTAAETETEAALSPQEYGMDEIVSALGDTPQGSAAAEILSENIGDQTVQSALGAADPAAVLALNPLRLLDGLVRMFAERAVSPLKMFIAVAAAASMCGLINALPKSNNIVTAKLAATLFAAAAVFGHAGMWLEECRASLSAGGAFMLTFVPVYSGIMAVTGQVAGASAWNAAMLIESQVFTAVLTAIIMPLCEGILALSLISAAFSDSAGSIGNIAAFVKKAVTWALGFIMALFIGLMSVQSVIAGAADNGASKALKFAVSGSLPIIGSAVGDGIATFRSSMGIMRAGMGSFGTAAFILVMLPGILTAVGYKFAFAAGRGMSGLFGVAAMTGMLTAAETAVDIALACLIGFAVITVVSVAVVMSFGGGIS